MSLRLNTQKLPLDFKTRFQFRGLRVNGENEKETEEKMLFFREKIIKSLAGPADVWNWAIENIWNVMKMRLKDMRPRPRTKATMRNAMIGIWDELEDDLRENLI